VLKEREGGRGREREEEEGRRRESFHWLSCVDLLVRLYL